MMSGVHTSARLRATPRIDISSRAPQATPPGKPHAGRSPWKIDVIGRLRMRCQFVEHMFMHLLLSRVFSCAFGDVGVGDFHPSALRRAPQIRATRRPLTAGGFRAMMVDGEWALRAETADRARARRFVVGPVGSLSGSASFGSCEVAVYAQSRWNSAHQRVFDGDLSCEGQPRLRRRRPPRVCAQASAWHSVWGTFEGNVVVGVYELLFRRLADSSWPCDGKLAPLSFRACLQPSCEERAVFRALIGP